MLSPPEADLDSTGPASSRRQLPIGAANPVSLRSMPSVSLLEILFPKLGGQLYRDALSCSFPRGRAGSCQSKSAALATRSPVPHCSGSVRSSCRIQPVVDRDVIQLEYTPAASALTCRARCSHRTIHPRPISVPTAGQQLRQRLRRAGMLFGPRLSRTDCPSTFLRAALSSRPKATVELNLSRLLSATMAAMRCASMSNRLLKRRAAMPYLLLSARRGSMSASAIQPARDQFLFRASRLQGRVIPLIVLLIIALRRLRRRQL